MFPPNNSLHNPFFSSPSSSPYVDLSPFIIHHQDPNQVQIQNQNPVSFSPATISNNAMLCSSKGEFVNENGFGEKRRPPKKDRHSKIYTAQGLRDRRVRMSIGIARKFFDLQDLLGFDKASKTLEWLLTKSQNAILQLSINSKTVSSCEQQNGDDMNPKDEKKKKKKMKKKASEASDAKELRDKARARARERTRLKMMLSTAKCNDSNQSKWNLLNHFHQQPSSSTVNGESIFIKSKSMMGYQQNLIFFKDSDFSNNNNKNVSDLHLNSDSNSPVARPNVCMHRSAGTYMWDKLWE